MHDRPSGYENHGLRLLKVCNVMIPCKISSIFPSPVTLFSVLWMAEVWYCMAHEQKPTHEFPIDLAIVPGDILRGTKCGHLALNSSSTSGAVLGLPKFPTNKLSEIWILCCTNITKWDVRNYFPRCLCVSHFYYLRTSGIWRSFAQSLKLSQIDENSGEFVPPPRSGGRKRSHSYSNLIAPVI